MPRRKGKDPKQEATPTESDPEAIEENDVDNTNNPNIEEYLPKAQTEWFHMVIKAQVRKVITECLEEQEKLLTQKITQAMEDKTKELENKILKLNRALDGVNKDLARKNDEINLLKTHIDSVEQKQKETRLRIAGVDEESDENLQKKIVKIAKSKLGMKRLKEDDIQEVYRAGKKKEHRTRDIVVEFTKKSTRDEYLHQRTKIPRTTDPKRRLYINEDLTEFRQKLLFDARQKVKCGKSKGAWCQHGNIMVLKSEGRPTAIKDHNDLRALTRSGEYMSTAGGPENEEHDEQASGTSNDISSQYSITDYDIY